MSLHRSWKREAVSALIEIYEMYPFLYDTRHPEYHSRKMNRDALELMVHVVSQYHPNVTAEDCKKKYQGLRRQFLAECRKLADSRKSGADTSSLYTPKLWCFDDLLFLRYFVRYRVGAFEEDDEEEVEEEEETAEDISVQYFDDMFKDSEVSTPSPPTPPESCTSAAAAAARKSPSSGSAAPGKRALLSPVPECSAQKKRNICDDRESTSSSEYTSSRESTPTGRFGSDSTTATAIASTSDDYDVFGNFVASRLRNLGRECSDEVEHDIVKLIFAAEKRKKYNS